MNKSPISRIPLFKIKVAEKGVIKDIREIVVRADGLPNCLYGQIVKMGDDGVRGIIMGYDENDVLILVLGDESHLRTGTRVDGISEPFEIPVGEGFLGRMVSAMGEPCDRQPPIEADDYQSILKDSPPITARAPVDEFLHTGTKIIDMIVPIAKGQRQLILGDRITGKTVITLDAIINQKNRDCVCIYCCIGKSLAGLEKVASRLHKAGALDYSVIVVATDSAPASEQYLVPFSAATIGEYFVGQGKDVLVVFDDLTKHAWAYRQLSLLLDRSPGREAYPGDIFYVQTQLMERAGRFNDAHGGGSMTFLGIAETLQGDLTGYIPSNLASMCDGQICMDSTAFAEGFRPAVDLGVSLSIIGGRVQPEILKRLCSTLRSDVAKYDEVSVLSRLQTGMSKEAEATMKKGRAIMAILQQDEYHPNSLAEEVFLLYALHQDLLADLSDGEMKEFREGVSSFAVESERDLVGDIERRAELTPEIERKLDRLMNAYFNEEGGPFKR